MSRLTSCWTVIVIVLMTTSIWGQSYFSGPENATFDYANDRWLISNYSSGTVVEIDRYGRMKYFITGRPNCDAAAICDNTFYTGSHDHLAGYDLTTKELVFELAVPEAALLNCMVADTSGYLYITDGMPGKIYKVNTSDGTYSVFVDGAIQLPVGLYCDTTNNRLLVASTPAELAMIYAVDLADSSVSLICTTSVGYIDAITRDNWGNYYVSCDESGYGRVYRLDSAFQNAEMLFECRDWLGQLCYNQRNHVLAVPNFEASEVAFVEPFFSAACDTNIGWVPFDIQLTATPESGASSWLWDFGDGLTSEEQSPTHTYQQPGFHDVSVSMTDDEGRTVSRTYYGMVSALADTMQAQPAEGESGSVVKMTVWATNNVPVSIIKIPIEYAGDIDLAMDSFSVAGTRTEHFNYAVFLHSDPLNKRRTIKLEALASSNTAPLQPGSGPIANVFFTVGASAAAGDSTIVQTDGYLQYEPSFSGWSFTYRPVTDSSVVRCVTCCQMRGDVDYSGQIDISDVTYFVEYFIARGPAPPCDDAANIDGAGTLTISDLTYLVDYLFAAGQPPPAC